MPDDRKLNDRKLNDRKNRAEIERCQAVIGALSESVRTLTKALQLARREAEEAKLAASAAQELAAARMNESGDRDIAIGTLFQRIEAVERLLRIGTSKRQEADPPAPLN